MKTTRTNLLLLAILGLTCILSASCVGKKKFRREVALRDSTNMALNGRILSLNQEIGQLKLTLAEKNGKNEALTELQKSQNEQISRLKDEIDKLTNQSLSQQQNMDLALKKKAEEVAEKERIIQGLGNSLEQQEKSLDDVSLKIQAALEPLALDQVSVVVNGRKLSIGLSEKLLFRSGKTTLEPKAVSALEAISNVLIEHPEFSLSVVGHTDNTPVKNKNYTDNWDLSAVEAAAVARTLSREFGLNPSQITVSGKGEYEPRASNESAETRELNRRVEILLTPQYQQVLDQLKQQTKK
ncbi:MAG: OmpA family protein [Lewinellaceae bacterium]|nr:OmpA family protein [Saprospiraceae bacterium]MCB9336988.1 OmpA family protein [Lewinellaceae bacterium]